MLDPWPRLLSRPVIWNDGTRVGDVRLAPEDPRARRLDRIVSSGAPLTAALRAAGVQFVVVDADPGDPQASPASLRARLPGCRIVLTGPDLVVCQVPWGGRGAEGAPVNILNKLLVSHSHLTLVSHPSSDGGGTLSRLIIAIVVGVVIAIGAVALTENLLNNAANGTPSQASLYQYGNR
jgi:hypothetical protein